MKCEICKEAVLDVALWLTVGGLEYHKSCYDKSIIEAQPTPEKPEVSPQEAKPSEETPLKALKDWYIGHGFTKEIRWNIVNLLGDMFGSKHELTEYARKMWNDLPTEPPAESTEVEELVTTKEMKRLYERMNEIGTLVDRLMRRYNELQELVNRLAKESKLKKEANG